MHVWIYYIVLCLPVMISNVTDPRSIFLVKVANVEYREPEAFDC